MYNMDYYYAPYLMHHGTKGQRWGQRRYQNKDGSLTALGRRRLGIKDTSSSNFKSRTSSNISVKTVGSSSQAPKRKTVKTMSDAEIQEKINRMKLEQEYRNTRSSIKSQNAENRKSTQQNSQAQSSQQTPIQSMKKDYSSKAMTSKKSLSEMTNDEIGEYLVRKDLENRYAALNPKKISAGRKIANTVSKDILTPVLVAEGKKVLQHTMDEMLKKKGLISSKG